MIGELVEHALLPGVEGTLKGPIVQTYSGAVRALKVHRVAAAAASHCAIIVWKDDAGQYRGGIYVGRSLQKEVISKSVYKLRNEMRQWWPGLRNPETLRERLVA